jgi:hypothetical protein
MYSHVIKLDICPIEEFIHTHHHHITAPHSIMLLPRMCPHVAHQPVGPRERLAARLADMRLLPCVRAHVL